jgi:hypothetical protein
VAASVREKVSFPVGFWVITPGAGELNDVETPIDSVDGIPAVAGLSVPSQLTAAKVWTPINNTAIAIAIEKTFMILFLLIEQCFVVLGFKK